MKKTAAESHRILEEVYGEYALSARTCQKWFTRFKSGEFDLEDHERPGQPKKFKDDELETLLDKDSCKTQGELAESLGVSRTTISKRLKAMGMVQKPCTSAAEQSVNVKRKKKECQQQQQQDSG